MTEVTLVVGATFLVVASAVYGGVGHLIRHRTVAPEARQAARMFVIWWYALALSTLATAGITVLAALGVTDLPLFVAITMVNIAVICVALAGLLHYLLYLFTGRDLLRLLVPFYLLYFGALVYWVMWSGPIGVEVDRWTVQLAYGRESRTALLGIVLLLVGPQFLGALAYGTLFWRTKDAAARLRIAGVSLSILIWFGSTIIASATAYAQTDVWQVVSRVIGLLAALAILAVYAPPAWLKRRLERASPAVG